MKQLLIALLFGGILLANDAEVRCLQENIYHESRGSNIADQAAVADVVMNRVESNKFPNTVCEVVKQGRYWKGNPVRNKCQFSWYCDGRSDKMLDTDAAESAYLLAYQVINYKRFRGITEGADHYHATYVNPYWAKHFNLVGTIGKHVYYKSN